MLKITGVILTLALVFGISAYWTTTWIIKSEDTIVVPDLIGKDVVDVLEMLTRMGLNTKVKGFEYSADIGKNHVVFQEPDPGAVIKQGRDVRIIISKGTKTILTPNVMGLPIRQARLILEENDLHPGNLSMTYSSPHHKDEIISQFPLPGVLTKRGDRIDLLVSIGKRLQSYLMPNLTGLSLEEAVHRIENLNLSLGRFDSAFQKNRPRHTVLTQQPLAGHPIFEGNPVDLVFNRTPGGKGNNSLKDISGVHLFRYRTENGFLKKHIRVQMNIFGTSLELVNEFVKPGREIRLLVPNDTDATVLLYEDGELVITETFGSWPDGDGESEGIPGDLTPKF